MTVFGSDQGLVGQFNEAMAEFVESTLPTLPGEKKIWTVGERLNARLTDAGLRLAGKFGVPSSVKAITSLVGQLQMASEAPGKSACTEVQVFHSRPASGASGNQCANACCPSISSGKKISRKFIGRQKIYRNSSDVMKQRSVLSSANIFSFLFSKPALSLWPAKMPAASPPCTARRRILIPLKNLNRTFHRLRQSSIDEELFDVIAGLNALSESAPPLRQRE